MRVCFPDASVILKWVLPPENESYAEVAEMMRDGFVTGEEAERDRGLAEHPRVRWNGGDGQLVPKVEVVPGVQVLF